MVYYGNTTCKGSYRSLQFTPGSLLPSSAGQSQRIEVTHVACGTALRIRGGMQLLQLVQDAIVDLGRQTPTKRARDAINAFLHQLAILGEDSGQVGRVRETVGAFVRRRRRAGEPGRRG